MTRHVPARRVARSRFSLTSIISLALGRVRQMRFLMSIITLGMLAAIVIVCVVPTFTSVMNTAALRSMLTSNAANAEIKVHTTTLGLSTAVQRQVGEEFATLLWQRMGTTARFLHPSQSSIISTNFSFAQTPPEQERSLVLYGVDMAQAAGHLGKLHGQLPAQATTMNEMDVLISTAAAKVLQLKIGDEVPLVLSYYHQLSYPFAPDPTKQANQSLTVRIAGIFDGDPKQADYWHGSDFNPVEQLSSDRVTTLITATMLVPNESLLLLADRLAAQNKSNAIFSDTPYFSLNWYYRLDTSQISIDDLGAMIADVDNVQNAYHAYYNPSDGISPSDQYAMPYLASTELSSPLFSQGQAAGVLDLFQQRVTVSLVSATVLTIQVMLLILFFVSLMTNLLLDRQAEVIALTRSRGASSGQIFAILLTQCLLMGLLAFGLGVPLAIGMVILMARLHLSGANQGALNIVTDHLPQVIWTNALYGLAILLVVLLAMGLQVFLTARMDVLAMRQQATRASRRPLWQRLHLDVIAGVLALISYGLSFYLTNISPLLQGDARSLIVRPLAVVAPFFLLIGGLLLFLRVFPLLLRLVSRLATRGEGAIPMLALAQISRAPRQPLRMTMLLALAITFTFFTLIYSASQGYHIQQITTYMIGADFSGRPGAVLPQRNPTKAEQPFQKIYGVLSTTVGYTTQAQGGKGMIPIEFRAVDATTFASTVVWPSQAEKDTGSKLLEQMVSRRKAMSAEPGVQAIPTIVDTVTASKLLLHVGSSFEVMIADLNVSTLQYSIVGIVPSIPTINNRLIIGKEGAPIPGGVLVDYTTFSTMYTRQAQHDLQNGKTRDVSSFSVDPPALNAIWLHTAGDAASLANVRTAFTKPGTRLLQVSDRWQLLANLTNDPLYLVLSGVLSIGTITALLLALVGDLLASWLSARTRLLNFAIVRALGSTLGEVANVLAWEQVIIYGTGLLLGAAFGWLLAASMIPALTFTDLNTNVNQNQFYALQAAFPIQVIIPPTLLLGLPGLGALFILMLALSVRVVSLPMLGQVLRLNED